MRRGDVVDGRRSRCKCRRSSSFGVLGGRQALQRTLLARDQSHVCSCISQDRACVMQGERRNRVSRRRLYARRTSLSAAPHAPVRTAPCSPSAVSMLDSLGHEMQQFGGSGFLASTRCSARVLRRQRNRLDVSWPDWAKDSPNEEKEPRFDPNKGTEAKKRLLKDARTLAGASDMCKSPLLGSTKDGSGVQPQAEEW